MVWFLTGLPFQRGGVGMGWALPGMNELKDRKAKVRWHVMHGRLHSMVMLRRALSDPRVGDGLSPGSVLSFIVPDVNLYMKLSVHTSIIHRMTTYTQHNVLASRILGNEKSGKLLMYNLFLLTIIAMHRQYLDSGPGWYLLKHVVCWSCVLCVSSLELFEICRCYLLTRPPCNTSSSTSARRYRTTFIITVILIIRRGHIPSCNSRWRCRRGLAVIDCMSFSFLPLFSVCTIQFHCLQIMYITWFLCTIYFIDVLLWMSIVDVFFNIFYEFSLMIIICNTCIMIAFLSFVKCWIFYPICLCHICFFLFYFQYKVIMEIIICDTLQIIM